MLQAREIAPGGEQIARVRFEQYHYLFHGMVVNDEEMGNWKIFTSSLGPSHRTFEGALDGAVSGGVGDGRGGEWRVGAQAPRRAHHLFLAGIHQAAPSV